MNGECKRKPNKRRTLLAAFLGEERQWDTRGAKQRCIGGEFGAEDWQEVVEARVVREDLAEAGAPRERVVSVGEVQVEGDKRRVEVEEFADASDEEGITGFDLDTELGGKERRDDVGAEFLDERAVCKFSECFSDADGADISGGVSSRSMFVESNQVGLAKDVSKPGG